MRQIAYVAEKLGNFDTIHLMTVEGLNAVYEALLLNAKNERLQIGVDHWLVKAHTELKALVSDIQK